MNLSLPNETPLGEVDIMIYPKEKPVPLMTMEEIFEELANFHKGQRLDGLVIKDMINEGRM